MSRINTNIQSLIAQRVLTTNNFFHAPVALIGKGPRYSVHPVVIAVVGVAAGPVVQLAVQLNCSFRTLRRAASTSIVMTSPCVVSPPNTTPTGGATAAEPVVGINAADPTTIMNAT